MARPTSKSASPADVTAAGRSAGSAPPVVIATGGADPLADALEWVGAWGLFEARRRSRRAKRAELAVAILVSFDRFGDDPPGGGGARLVEHLIDLLHDRGYESVAVVGSEGAGARWFDNLQVLAVADLTGFRFDTPTGRPYDVGDLSDDLVEGPFPEESCLHGQSVGRAWLEAGVRIIVTPAATDLATGYRSSVEQLVSVLGARDKVEQYAVRRDAGEVGRDLLRAVPPLLCLVDALGVGDHDTVIAGVDALAVDVVTATKLGVDPYANPATATALRENGFGTELTIDGDLGPFPTTIAPVRSLSADVRRMTRSSAVAGLLPGVATAVDPERFPSRQPAVGRLNDLVTRAMRTADRSPATALSLRWAAWAAAATVEALDAWRTVYAKDRIRVSTPSLGVDLARFGPEDYEAVEGYLEPFTLVAASDDAEDGELRWRYVDGAVLFQVSGEVPVAFSSWCERVDISRSIQFMTDYVGGRCVPVARDSSGRVVHQAERNLYLPQPNYLALAGAPPIDVVKLEVIRYGDREQSIRWRTILSPNRSAELDDGMVRFRALGADRTLVTIMALQRFVLPPFWQLVDVERLPEVKDALVDDAYRSFFGQTMENLWQEYLGDRRPIGRDPDQRHDGDGRDDDSPAPEDVIGPVLAWGRRAAETFDTERGRALVDRIVGRRGATGRSGLDDDGFTHGQFREASGERRTAGPAASGPGALVAPMRRFVRDITSAAAHDVTHGLGDVMDDWSPPR